MSHPWLSFRCDRSWADLEGSGPRRRCDRCARAVHDLEAPEARVALPASGRSTCVRFLAAAMLGTLAGAPARAQEPAQETPHELPAEEAVRPGEGPLPDLAPRQEVMGMFDRSLVEEGLAPLRAALRVAWAERLKEKPGLQGKMVVQFTIAAGVVSEAHLERSTLGDEVFEKIVVERVKEAVFERMRSAGQGPAIVVNYPFVFVSGDDSAP